MYKIFYNQQTLYTCAATRGRIQSPLPLLKVLSPLVGYTTMVKRKRSEIVATVANSTALASAASTRTRRSLGSAQANGIATSPTRRTPRRLSTLNVNYTDRDFEEAEAEAEVSVVDKNITKDHEDDEYSSSGSPLSSAPPSDVEGKEEKVAVVVTKKEVKRVSKVAIAKKPAKKKQKSAQVKPEDEDEDAPPSATEIVGASTLPEHINSDYVPIPWKGRLGYACLNTYLRSSDPPIFCSRTCKIATILKHNENDGAGAGLAYLKSLGLANASDLSKLIEWNERYGIKFLRISSEMFPFASHDVYGYDLEFAEEPLRRAGQLAMKYGHRLTMHPGQYTQIGSPTEKVVEAAVRDLKHHCELLDRLGLTGQADRDAVMIIHMGGVYGDKPATIERFKKNYRERLTDGIRKRLVLENDDVSYCVEDVLPVCQELGVPLVLDWHHHNILPGTMREGTLDVLEKYSEAIAKTWTDKGITQKQHMSEARPDAVTKRDMIKHSKRIRTLPPCADNMDLMLEAKDKEQAVFELMKTYNLPGIELINDVIPHERQDQNMEVKPTKKKKKKATAEEEDKGALQVTPPRIPEEEVAMGGPERRVYYPQGNDDWLLPKKKERKKKTDGGIAADGEDLAEADEKISISKSLTKKGRKSRKAVVKEEEVVEEEVAVKGAKRGKKATPLVTDTSETAVVTAPPKRP